MIAFSCLSRCIAGTIKLQEPGLVYQLRRVLRSRENNCGFYGKRFQKFSRTFWYLGSLQIGKNGPSRREYASKTVRTRQKFHQRTNDTHLVRSSFSHKASRNPKTSLLRKGQVRVQLHAFG